MSAFELIRCDGCGQGYEWTKLGASNFKVLRDVLRKEGWHRVVRKGKAVRDICAKCWKEGQR